MFFVVANEKKTQYLLSLFLLVLMIFIGEFKDTIEYFAKER